MKNILIIIGKLYIGGAERIGRDIGFYANKKKYKIHYIVFGEETGAYEAELGAVGCVIHHLASPSESYLKYYRCLIDLIRREHIDVIHSHTMFSSGWAMLAGKQCGVSVRIVHSHTIRGSEKRGFIKNLYESVMRKVVVHNATELVACGKEAGDWFYGKKAFQRKGTLIYNGINLAEYTFDVESREKIKNQYHLKNRLVIGHVGHLSPVKNQKFLISLMPELLKSVPNAMLLLLGDGEDRLFLQGLIKDLQMEEHVIMTGNVNNVGQFMSAMDVFAFPSLYEGMPLALVEAQANGLPCLISDHIPKDIYLTDLIKAIPLGQTAEEWIEDIGKAERLDPSSYGRQMYQLGFDTSGMLKKIYSLYEG